MVDVAPVHVLGLVVSLLFLHRSFLLVRNGHEAILEFLFWTSFGVGALLATLVALQTGASPVDAAGIVLQVLRVRSGMDGLLVGVTVALFAIACYTYAVAKANHKRVADLQQEIGLLRYELDQLEEETVSNSSHQVVENAGAGREPREIGRQSDDE